MKYFFFFFFVALAACGESTDTDSTDSTDSTDTDSTDSTDSTDTDSTDSDDDTDHDTDTASCTPDRLDREFEVWYDYGNPWDADSPGTSKCHCFGSTVYCTLDGTDPTPENYSYGFPVNDPNLTCTDDGFQYDYGDHTLVADAID